MGIKLFELDVLGENDEKIQNEPTVMICFSSVTVTNYYYIIVVTVELMTNLSVLDRRTPTARSRPGCIDSPFT